MAQETKICSACRMPNQIKNRKCFNCGHAFASPEEYQKEMDALKKSEDLSLKKRQLLKPSVAKKTEYAFSRFFNIIYSIIKIALILVIVALIAYGGFYLYNRKFPKKDINLPKYEEISFWDMNGRGYGAAIYIPAEECTLDFLIPLSQEIYHKNRGGLINIAYFDDKTAAGLYNSSEAAQSEGQQNYLFSHFRASLQKPDENEPILTIYSDARNKIGEATPIR